MQLKNLHQLFIDELRQLYSGEKQISDALPKMAKADVSAAARIRRRPRTLDTSEGP